MRLLSLILLTACSDSSEEGPLSSGSPVSFTTQVESRASSASVTDATALAAAGFGVFAFQTGTDDYSAGTFTPDFMYNQQVSGADWTYTPVKYWPADETHKVAFFAYAPYTADADTTGITAMTANTSTDAPAVNYQIDTWGHNRDLVWAAEPNHVRTDGKVTLNFRHALARIGGIAADGGLQAALYTDDKGHIVGADTTVTTTLTLTAVRISQTGLQRGDTLVTDSAYTAGTFNLVTGTWTDSTRTDISDSPMHYSLSADAAQEGINGVLKSGLTLTATPQNVFLSEASPLLVIPVSDRKPVFKVTVTYTLQAGTETRTLTTSRQVILNQVPVQGKRYDLTLYIGINRIRVMDKTTGEWYNGPYIQDANPSDDDLPWLSKHNTPSML